MQQAVQLRRSNIIVNEGKPQPMTDVLKGRTVERILRTNEQFIIRCDDGLEVRISWRDDRGRMIGTPVLDEARRWK